MKNINYICNVKGTDMKTKTQIQKYFESLPVGEVINKKGLAYLKRLGYIWDYSKWGYLESVRIYGVRESDGYRVEDWRYTFPKGNAKELEQYEGAMYEKWRQSGANTELTRDEIYEKFGSDRGFEVNGIKFGHKYFDGCFNAYLIKTGPENGREVNHRMAFPGGVI